MVIGYIRVSKTEQNQDLQFDSLKKAGCEKIYHEKVSGASLQRPEYIRMISELRKGDVIVVWRIDRLGRTTYELIKLMVEWKEMGVDFRSISEGIDTSTKMGRLWYMLSSVFAENLGKAFGSWLRAALHEVNPLYLRNLFSNRRDIFDADRFD